MRKEFLSLIIIFCISISCNFIHGQNSYNYEQLTVKDGLLSNRVNVIFRDKIGYVWIGTNEGLHKYDGENMYTYHFKRESSSGLSGKIINFIFEDANSNLWIGTDSNLFIYNRDTDKFINHKNRLLNQNFFTYSVLPDCIAFGNRKGLFFYYYETDSVKELEFKDIDAPLDNLSKLTTINDSTIALVSHSGLWNYNLNSNKVIPIDQFKIHGTISLLIDKKGSLWLGCNEGLKVYDKNGKSIDGLSIEKKLNSNSYFIQDIAEHDEKIWISTDGKGIYIYDFQKDSYQNICHKQEDRNSLASNSILDLYVDNFGNILAGSVRGGLISINEVFIQSFSEDTPGNNQGLSHPTVLAIHEDDNSKIWIGTDGGGLNFFDTETETFEHIKEFSNSKVVSICTYGPDKLLLSIYRDRVYLFDTKLKQIESSDRYPWLAKLSEIGSSAPIILKRDQHGNIWKFGRELKVMKPDNSIEIVNKQNGWTGDLESRFSDLIPLNNDEILLGGVTGAYKINLKEKSSTNVLSILENEEEHIYIFSLTKSDNTIWIASTVGLLSLDLSNNFVKYYNNDLFSKVYGVANAGDSSIWLGSNQGLYRYDPKTNNFQLFGRFDGVKHYEYVNRSVCKSKEGDLYFGASSGLIKIEPSNIPLGPSGDIHISFDHFLSDGVRIDKGSNSQLIDNELFLPWDNTSLQIKLVLNEKDFFRKRLFRYRIKGYSDNLIESSNSQLTLSHLPAGEFTLQVFGNKPDGSWMEEPACLSINVSLPWWKEWWFTICLLIVMITLFLLIRHYIIKQSQLVFELELERELKEQSKQLNEQKLEFFTNISHELRTPLSLIYGPLKQLVTEKESTSDNSSKQMQLMYRQAGKMKRLVDQVLDIRKMDAGKDEIIITHLALNEWIDQFFLQYELEFESKNLKLISNFTQTLTVDIDVDKLDKILSNILSNAIKYSPIGGEIYFDISQENERLIFSIGDEGPGINEDEKDKLFDRFFQAKNHKSGSGVGLAFVDSLIKILDGNIWANNRPEGGALIKFNLPLQISEDKKTIHETYFNTSSHKSKDIDFSFLHDKTVLVVEDDNDLRKFIVEGLTQYCNVIEACNGKEAWHLTLSTVPDIIVSDIMMPIMDGFKLCEKIKKDLIVSHIPILLLTARSDANSRLLGYRCGADAYLSKPFSLNILSVRLINILKNREAQKELFKVDNEHAITSITHSNPDEVFLKKIILIINENMEDSTFDVTRLNAEVAMSRSVFYAKVKAITGQGVNDFIKQLKINKAAKLLTKTELSIGEIANKVGYENQRYFSTVFKEIKKNTPSQYRQLKK